MLLWEAFRQAEHFIVTKYHSLLSLSVVWEWNFNTQAKTILQHREHCTWIKYTHDKDFAYAGM